MMRSLSLECTTVGWPDTAACIRESALGIGNDLYARADRGAAPTPYSALISAGEPSIQGVAAHHSSHPHT